MRRALATSIGAAAAALFLAVVLRLCATDAAAPLRRRLNAAFEFPLTAADTTQSTDTLDGLYILGGDTRALMAHADEAARLYQGGTVRRVLIADDSGKTEYAPDLRRNLRNHEWLARRLMHGGVPLESVVTVAVKRGYFGTLLEACAVAQWACESGARRVGCVSSRGHTRRVRLAFGRALRGSGCALHVFASRHELYLSEKWLEFVKLMVYTLIARPAPPER